MASHFLATKLSLATRRLLCLLIVSSGLTLACAEESPMRIRCELSMPKTLASAQAAELSFTLTNAGDAAIQFLNWQTPFEGIRAPMFEVTRGGVSVEYQGRMLKRGNPRKEDYVVLKPGEQKSATIDLSEAWDVSTPGSYTVEYAAELFDVISGTTSAPRSVDEFNAVTLNCGSVAFTRLR
jgi:hypothetical protein